MKTVVIIGAGIGMPMVMLSARLLAERLAKEQAVTSVAFSRAGGCSP